MQKQLNFNQEENQDRCIFRDYPKVNGKIEYGGIPLAYFIYNRNYGWCRYKDVLFNLNNHDQAESFISALTLEGFLYKDRSGYTINDTNFINFKYVYRHILLYFLYYTKAKPLSEEECIKRDKEVNQHI